MKQRLNIVTLGVSDLERARRFYCQGLGWTSTSASSGDIEFLELGGVVLALYPRHLLAEDAGLPSAADARGFGGITLAQNVGSKVEVDRALEAARLAGATVLKPAQQASWGGYSGYFADLDGYPWEVAYNPHWPLGPDGRLTPRG
jgi:catechol 2,3-dioxygenase-like lactoylglutathione lyase family enzyme